MLINLLNLIQFLLTPSLLNVQFGKYKVRLIDMALVIILCSTSITIVNYTYSYYVYGNKIFISTKADVD